MGVSESEWIEPKMKVSWSLQVGHDGYLIDGSIFNAIPINARQQGTSATQTRFSFLSARISLGLRIFASTEADYWGMLLARMWKRANKAGDGRLMDLVHWMIVESTRTVTGINILSLHLSYLEPRHLGPARGPHDTWVCASFKVWRSRSWMLDGINLWVIGDA